LEVFLRRSLIVTCVLAIVLGSSYITPLAAAPEPPGVVGVANTRQVADPLAGAAANGVM
jgi:hypothetical protein